MIAGLEWPLLLACLPVVFIAALVRGYSGFGFSALTIASLSILIAPAKIVPVILLVEIVAGIGMLPSVWKHIDWRQLRLIGSFGCNLRNIRDALDKLAEGTVKPVVDLEIPMEDIGKGLERLENRQVFGKIIVTI